MLHNVFFRKNLSSPSAIISWWARGLGFLNALVFILVLLHLTVTVFVFHNGWVFFLLPFIIGAFAIINLTYLTGLLVELLAKIVFHSKLNFDTVAPRFQRVEFALSIAFILALSFYDLSRQN